MIDNRDFLQKLHVINGYRIEYFVKSLRPFTQTEINEPFSNGNSNDEVEDLGYVDPDFNKRMCEKTGCKPPKTYYDKNFAPMPKYSFFDFTEHKNIIVRYDGKIISRS